MHRRLFGAGKPSGADHDRLAEGRGELGVIRRRGRHREIHRHIAVAQQPLGIVADGDAEAGNPGQLAQILADAGGARASDPAGQDAALGCGDVGDQHASHPAGASDHPNPGPGHGCLPCR